MNSNVGEAHGGLGLVSETNTMDCYDRLPLRLREILAAAPFDYETEDVLRRWCLHTNRGGCTVDFAAKLTLNIQRDHREAQDEIHAMCRRA